MLICQASNLSILALGSAQFGKEILFIPLILSTCDGGLGHMGFHYGVCVYF